MPKVREPWIYKKLVVIPVCANSAGIRWCCSAKVGVILKSDTKHGMRKLITQAQEGTHV